MLKFTSALMLAAGAFATSLSAYSSRSRERRPRPEVPEVDDATQNLLDRIDEMHSVVDLDDDGLVSVDELT